jgi:RNA polymerase sigma-70 factor (ECF subfamily)
MRTNQPFLLDEEEILVKQLISGNRNAVRFWYKKFFSDFLNFTLNKVPNRADAEEIVQETFINSLRQISLFRGKSKLKTWMTSILLHEIADYYRKKYAKKALKTIPLFEEILQKPLISSSDLNDKVEEVLYEMKKEYRDLLLQKYFDKKKVKDIAAKMKRTVKAVESDLFRARKEFKEIYLAKGYLEI